MRQATTDGMADSPLLAVGSAKSPSKCGYSVFAVTISLAGVACVATTMGILLAPKPSPATPVASQIQLHYFNGSTTKMEVDFASTTQSGSVGVEFGTSADTLFFGAAASSIQYSVQETGYTSPYLYSAVLDLSKLGSPLPARVYYRVVTLSSDGVGTSTGTAWSSVYSFPPHPGIGVPGVTVAVLGDLGTTNNSVDTMAHLFAGGARPAFSSIVLAGDLSYADGEQPVWDYFGDTFTPYTATVPMMTAVGNHEWFETPYSFTAYEARYNMAPELYYAYSAGLTRFVVIAGYCPEMNSTATQPCLQPGKPQRVWLEAELASVNRAVTPWVVVVIHQPWMNSNTAHSIAKEGLVVKDAIEDVLNAAHVDLVLAGHVHAYERCCRAYNYACNVTGPYYITIGDGGNCEGLQSSWVDPQPAWSVVRRASYGHGLLTAVNATHLQWRWYQNPDLAPVVGDELWIVKTLVGVPVADAEGSAWQGTHTPVFATPEAAAANDERVRLGGKYCAKGGWTPA